MPKSTSQRRRLLLEPLNVNDPPGLVLWCRHQIGITNTGSGVSQWDDQSGQGNHLKQGTDASRPVANGAAGILFDGVDDFLKADAFTLVQPETVYLLCKQITWVEFDRFMDGDTALTGVMYNTVATPRIAISADTALANPDFTQPVLDTYNALVAVFNGASSVIQVNNDTPGEGDAGADNLDGFSLGAGGTPAAAWSNIQVKEVLVYNTAHDAPTREKIVNYLLNTVNVSASL